MDNQSAPATDAQQNAAAGAGAAGSEQLNIKVKA